MKTKTGRIASTATVRSRPDFAVEPRPGQESVWDYPRPPAILRDGRLVEVRDGNAVVAASKGAYKVMETASPPTFYIPAEPVGWCYERPRPRFEIIKRYLAFYPGRVDCCLDGEPVRTQPGRFYGGWITSEVVGPFKGEPGTGHW